MTDKRLGKHPDGRSSRRRGTLADSQPAQILQNKTDAPPLRHGVSWSADEDDQLRAAFRAGEAIAAIAASHERKVGAITARLVRLGLITEDGVVQPD